MTDEEMAEEWVKENMDCVKTVSYLNHDCNYFSDEERSIAKSAFKDGYNKANEWHYVKDGDLPTKELEEKQLLVRVRNYTENFIFAYYMLDKYYSKNGKRFYSDTDCNYPIDIGDVIAWKEIVLPKEE